MTNPTHRITVEVMRSLTDPTNFWAVPERSLIRMGHPNIIKVEEIPRPIAAGDVVRHNLSTSKKEVFNVIGVDGNQAWIKLTDGSGFGTLVYTHNLTRV